MPNMSDVKSDALYVMLKGEPGTRKSTQALSFPKPQYWFSVDKKMRALLLPMQQWNINPKDIEYDDYKDWMSIEAKLEQFEKLCKHYRTLVFDSVTSIGDVINMQTMNLKSGTTTAAGVEKGGRVGGIKINTLEDYKAEASAFATLIAKTKDIQNAFKTNIVLIAHVVGERARDEVGVTAHTRIIITGGKTISGKIPAYCEETYHFDYEASVNPDKPGALQIYTANAGDDFARTTLNLPPRIKIGDDQLYEKHILPAITKLNSPIK